MMDFLKTVISKTKSTVKNTLNAISSRLKNILFLTPFLENNELEISKIGFKVKGIIPNTNQLLWFNECQKNSVNLICAFRQSGKTAFIEMYAQFLAEKNKKVLVVTLRIYSHYFFKSVNKTSVDYCSQHNVVKMLKHKRYDVVMFDEMAYFNSNFEHLFKTGLFSGIEKIITISSSRPDSLFNKLIINNLKTNSDPDLEFANTFNCVITKSKTHNKRTMNGYYYNVEFECQLE